MKRRTFLKSSVIAAALTPLIQSAAESPAPTPAAARDKHPRSHKKGFMLAMLNSATAQKLSFREKLDLLHGAGFDGVEVPSAMTQRKCSPRAMPPVWRSRVLSLRLTGRGRCPIPIPAYVKPVSRASSRVCGTHRPTVRVPCCWCRES